MTRAMYWCGWLMAAVLYLFIVADLAALAWLEDYDSMIVALIIDRKQEKFLALAWIVVTILFLSVED